MLRSDLLRVIGRNGLSVLESTNDALMIVDNNDIIHHVNNQLCNIVQYDREDLIGKTGHKLLFKNEYHELIKSKNLLRTQGTSDQYELEMVRQDRSYVRVTIKGAPIYNDDGTVVGSIGIISNIAESESVKTPLQHSQDRYFTLVENLRDIVFSLAIDGTITSLSSAFEKITGWKRSQWIGRHFSEIIHPNDVGFAFRQFEIHLNGEDTGTFELQIIGAEGSYQTIEFSTVSQKKGLHVEEVIGIGRDVTQRKQEEQKYVNLVNGINGGIMIANRNSVIQFVNKQLCTMLEYEPEELLGKISYEVFLDPEQQEVMKEAIQRRYLGIAERYEVLVNKKSGEKIWVEIGGSPFTDSHGTITGCIGILVDVSRRKEAQRSLEKERRFSKSIIDSSLDVIIAVDTYRHITEFNKAAELAFGYTREEVVGSHVSILYADDIQCEDVHKEMVFYGHSVREIINKRKNGELFTSYLSASTIRDEHDIAIGYMGVSRDITDQKKYEEKIKQLAAILEIIPDAVTVTNIDGQIMYWNQGAREIFGWTPEESLHRKINEHFGLTSGYFHEVIQSVLRNGQWSGECLLKNKASERRICLCRVSTMKDVYGISTSFLFVCTDMTEKKRLDEEFSQHQRMESLGRLAGSITHDLNNIFTPIVLNVDLLKQEARDPNAKETLEKIEAYIRRGMKLVKRILTFSHGDVQSFEPELININNVVDDVLGLIEDSIPKSVKCTRTATDKSLQVWGDSNQLFQVFINLLINARDAMPGGGVLRVLIDDTFIDSRRWVCVAVSDTGLGIESDILEKIFEPFFTTKEKGTGIGLATVNAIVKCHGGFVNVDSEVGRGSTFRIYLPVHPTDVRGTHSTSSGESAPLVLVIDDEREICHLFKSMLEMANYNVVTAHDGREGLEIFAKRFHQIKIVITDVRMPRMDGIHFIKAAREIDPNCRIILASANDFSQHQGRLHQIQAEIQGFLSKPFTREELLNSIQEAISASG